jgi:hypothetical protein
MFFKNALRTKYFLTHRQFSVLLPVAVSKITMVDFKVMLLSLAFIVALTQAKPFFIDCQSDSDCGVNACCAIGKLLCFLHSISRANY